MNVVRSEIAATVWKIETVAGAEVASGDLLVILESMKMEIPVVAPGAGVVAEILVHEGATVQEGEPLVTIGES